MEKNIIFIFIFFLALSIFLWNCRRLYKYMLTGMKKDQRHDEIGERLKKVIVVAFGQSKLFRDFPAGMLHFLIFWGFILFLFNVIESIVQGFYTPFNFSFLGALYSPVTLVQDLFGIFVIAACLYALYRRFVIHVPRLEVDKAGKIDAAVILALIIFICVTMFGMNIFLIGKENFILKANETRPVSAYLGMLFLEAGQSNKFFYELFWWAHIGGILVFLNYLPYSKHLHVLTSIPNTFFANPESRRNTIKPLDLETEDIEFFGAADIEQLSWKQILDGYSCTECGRCTAACPAANVGKSLSPRKIIVDIRKRTFEKAPHLISGETEHESFRKTLVHDYITDIELWECTTCNACVQECPVMIEHLDSIVDMRRDLVLSETRFPSNLNNVFKSIESNYTPWAFDSADRAKWAEGMDIKTMAEEPDCDVLFWVGCAGSFDNRYKKVTKKFASIMQKANINFRILGNEEKCNGDTARRLGNEYLAQMMIKENVQTLNKYNVKKIVTACPHCYHSLGHEYRQFGGNYEVIHHTQFINQLIEEKRIELKQNTAGKKVTYHDSCYLGRYNNIYGPPRKILDEVSGIELLEMKRNKSKGFCCGAGGGRMFLEDEEGGRINVERTREALETNPDAIASACPFCMTMITDGVKHFDKSEQIEVMDVAEFVFENIN